MPTLHEKVTYAIMNAFFSRPIEEQYFNASPSDNEDLGRAAIKAMLAPNALETASNVMIEGHHNCDEIERLQKRVEHFHQAMVKEAEARYAAETEIERLRGLVEVGEVDLERLRAHVQELDRLLREATKFTRLIGPE